MDDQYNTPSRFTRIKRAIAEDKTFYAYQAGMAVGIVATTLIAKGKINELKLANRLLDDEINNIAMTTGELIFFVEANGLKEKAAEFLKNSTEADLMAHIKAQTQS